MSSNSSKYQFDFYRLLTRTVPSISPSHNAITITAIQCWLHNKYQNGEWSCLVSGTDCLTGGESKNSAKINPQSNAG